MPFSLSQLTNPFLKTRKDEKERITEAYDRVINVIGLDHLKTLVPMWKDEGSTVLKDLVRKNISFNYINGDKPNRWTSGMLHDAPTPSTDATIVQAGFQQQILSSKAEKLDNPTKKLAQRLPLTMGMLSYLTLKLKRVGNPVGRIKVSICPEVAGKPNLAAPLMVSVPKSMSAMVVTDLPNTPYCPIHLTAPVELNRYISVPALYTENRLWLVIEADETTTVLDASNYVEWAYDDAPSLFTEMYKSVYENGAWTNSATKTSHTYVFYDNRLDLGTGDATIIVAANQGDSSQAMFSYNGASLRTYGYGEMDPSFGGLSGRTANTYKGWQVYVATIDVTNKKTTLYVDGRAVRTVSPGSPLPTTPRPVVIGGILTDFGELQNPMGAGLHSFAMASRALSAAEVAEVTQALMAVRISGGVN